VTSARVRSACLDRRSSRQNGVFVAANLSEALIRGRVRDVATLVRVADISPLFQSVLARWDLG
jgi:hypothetical protein